MVGDVDALQNLYVRGLGPPSSHLSSGSRASTVAAVILPAAGMILAVGLLAAGVLVPVLAAGLTRATGASTESRPRRANRRAGRASARRSRARRQRPRGGHPREDPGAEAELVRLGPRRVRGRPGRWTVGPPRRADRPGPRDGRHRPRRRRLDRVLVAPWPCSRSPVRHGPAAARRSSRARRLRRSRPARARAGRPEPAIRILRATPARPPPAVVALEAWRPVCAGERAVLAVDLGWSRGGESRSSVRAGPGRRRSRTCSASSTRRGRVTSGAGTCASCASTTCGDVRDRGPERAHLQLDDPCEPRPRAPGRDGRGARGRSRPRPPRGVGRIAHRRAGHARRRGRRHSPEGSVSA